MIDRTLPSFLSRPCVDSIEERDLDLLLLYELHASPAFRRFVLNVTTGVSEVRFIGAWRSVFDAMGESDVLLLCDLTDLGRTAIMIEDKIDAIFQDNQAGRYRQRGLRGVAEGAWDAVRICLCAPEQFLKPYRSGAFLPLEDIMAWLEPTNGSDPRSAFLSAALARATRKYERGSFAPDERAIAFWQQYQNICLTEFPEVELVGLRPVQSRNEPWPRFAVSCLPQDVRLEHKPWKGHVDLTFSGAAIEAIRARFSGRSPTFYRIEKAGGSTALRVAVTPISHTEPFGPQLVAVREALAAVRKLIAEWPHIRELMED